jgi:hypothetical protein
MQAKAGALEPEIGREQIVDLIVKIVRVADGVLFR